MNSKVYIFKQFGGRIIFINLQSECNRLKILTEPDRIGIILAGTGPEPDWITSQKKLTGFDRIGRIGHILPDLKNFNTQLTSHKHKYGSFYFEI